VYVFGQRDSSFFPSFVGTHQTHLFFFP
jgi:hypothetical protein